MVTTGDNSPDWNRLPTFFGHWFFRENSPSSWKNSEAVPSIIVSCLYYCWRFNALLFSFKLKVLLLSKISVNWSILNHLMPRVFFYTPRKYQKDTSFMKWDEMCQHGWNTWKIGWNGGRGGAGLLTETETETLIKIKYLKQESALSSSQETLVFKIIMSYKYIAKQ